MTPEEIKKRAADLRAIAAQIVKDDTSTVGLQASAIEFFTAVSGKRNAFVESARSLPIAMQDRARAGRLDALLASFIESVDSKFGGVSPQRQAELDVVSDFLEQAYRLLENQGVHPAAPIMLIGATLEEFLRTWVEAEGLSLGNRKPSLDAYTQVLRDADLIGKQDSKDLTAWGGLRNHAAHGEWDEVSDPQRAKLMFEGVNLFMRKHAPTS